MIVTTERLPLVKRIPLTISRGTSARTVALPGDIDAEHATARLKDGMLEVTLPKTAKAKRQRIAISA